MRPVLCTRDANQNPSQESTDRLLASSMPCGVSRCPGWQLLLAATRDCMLSGVLVLGVSSTVLAQVPGEAPEAAGPSRRPSLQLEDNRQPAADAASAAGNHSPANDIANDISLRQLRRHVMTLASDAFEGRRAGTRGGNAAGSYLASEFRQLELEPAGDEQSWFQYFGDGQRNVLARLPGSSPATDRSLILLGAHYDHVGYGRNGNSFGPSGRIHNGADDNASGVAVLLEVARVLSRSTALSGTVLLACWDAEEQGLLGSKHFVSRPEFRPRQVKLAINLDMVGRLRPQGIEVTGIRTATGMRNRIARANRDTGLRLYFPWTLVADSDHYPFIEQHIPTVMLHTGKHPQYHRPDDDVERLNLPGMREITRMVVELIRQTDAASDPPVWRKECLQETEELRKQTEVTLPPRPSRLRATWQSHAEGVELTGITANGGAARAGLLPGDVVLRFNGLPVLNAEHFSQQILAAPSSSQLLVRRQAAASAETIEVTLAGGPLRVGIHWRTDTAEPGCVILDRVTAHSPAALAGLQPGDRILSVNGQTFTSHREFHRLLTERLVSHGKPPAGVLSLQTERNGQLRVVQIPLHTPAGSDHPPGEETARASGM